LVSDDHGCGPCNILIPEIGSGRASRWPHVVVISRDSNEANRAKVTEHALTTVLVQNDNEIANHASGRTPSQRGTVTFTVGSRRSRGHQTSSNG
jgi:hypothetical protein